MILFNYKRITILIAVFLSISSICLHAEEATHVAIFPFSLEAKQPNPAVSEKITSLIAQILEKEGTKVTQTSPKDSNFQDWSFDQYKTFGLESGVDFILTGTVFQAGNSLSIDSKLINIYDKNAQTRFYSDSSDLENMLSAVSKVGKSIVGELFQKKVIIDIAVAGNKRIDRDAILRILDTKSGDIIKAENVTKDLRKIYEMGYFDNVVVNQDVLDTGVKLIYEVTEKATVRRIKFKKNLEYPDDELQEFVTTRTGSILNIHKIKADVNRMRLMYTTKNYHNIKINYEIIPLENSQADIAFIFEEGDKVTVEKITFEGNSFFSDKELGKEIETSEEGFFSFFTSSGDLDEIEVKNDVIRLESMYKNNGFIDAKVSDPIIDIGKEFITVIFKIDEGNQYKVSKIDIAGDLIQKKELYLDVLVSKENELYSRENLRKDVHAMADVYLNQGYANVLIDPKVDKDITTKTMKITYLINKGELVHFNRIRISGNTKTRDKVIRREIRIAEQGVYSKKQIEQSYRNLRRLDFFDQVKVTPIDTDSKNIKDLKVEVVEKETGAFSFGGGYSSEDAGFFMVSVMERNLFGKGQHGKLSFQLGDEKILYNLAFLEPHIFDTNISGGFDLYKEEKEYDFYDKDAVGLTLSSGYKFGDHIRIGMYYTIEDYEIKDVDTINSSMTSGSFLSSSIQPYIQYDSRNDRFLPTEGRKHKVSIEYAGSILGGDIDFVKYLAETTNYIPLFWKFTGMLHFEAGYLDDQTGNSIDLDYERFYLGGIHSIRGFDKWDIDGRRAGDTKDIGGEKYVQFNVELTFPLSEEFALAGVLFYDRGDVYRTSEDFDFGDQFSSVGAGFRWNSPMGPMRIEYGWVLEGKSIKERGDGQFEFSVGASF